MPRRLVIAALRSGWSRSRRAFAFAALFARAAVFVFVLHVSGAAHLLADVLLDDDMTCVDELAHNPQHDTTAPRCPAAQSFGCGQGAVPPAPAIVALEAPRGGDVAHAREIESAPPQAPPRTIDRPPRA